MLLSAGDDHRESDRTREGFPGGQRAILPNGAIAPHKLPAPTGGSHEW